MKGTVQAPQGSPAIDETSLRHPLERRYFVASVILNFTLMAAAIAILIHEPAWVKTHPIIDKELNVIRFLAITALVGIPFLVLNRNRREAYVRGNSVRLSRTQFPEVYAILEDHCRRLGMAEVPELFLTASTIQPFSQTYSSWRENYIVLHQILFDTDYHKTLDVVAFTLGHELAAIRLHHTAVWNEMLLTYVSAVKWLKNPLNRVRVFSRDRYGAYLAPTGFRGLLIYAAGRRMMNYVNVDEYFEQSRGYGGIWSGLNTFVEPVPQVLIRLQQLRAAGFRYTPRVEGAKTP
jgi:hypothetical protein